MNNTKNTIVLTNEQMEALQSGQSITIEPFKLEVTPIKWEPKGGNFLIGSTLNGSIQIENKYNEYSISGMRYQTETQADCAAKLLRSYARQLAWLSENDDGWVANWDNHSELKYTITYNYWKKRYIVEDNNEYASLNTIYMSENNSTKLCKLLNDNMVEF